MQDLTEQVRAQAKELLEQGSVDVVIGYGPTGDNGEMTAVFARTPEDSEKLALNGHCFRNLAIYLNKPEVRKLGRVAIVVKGCDRRAVNVLIREKRLNREDLYLIGVNCDGVGEPRMSKCSFCTVHAPRTATWSSATKSRRPSRMASSNGSRTSKPSPSKNVSSSGNNSLTSAFAATPVVRSAPCATANAA